MMRRASLLALVSCAVACAAAEGSSRGRGKMIDDVAAGEFRFGPMAIGQAKDVDYARAEGLGLVPPTPLDAYLNGVLAKLLAQSPTRNVPAKVYVRASGDWGAKTTADANIYVGLGTLLRLDDEDEVAALLAHEASHILLGHADADVVLDVQQRAIQLSTLALAAREAIQGGGKTGTAGGDSARVEEQSKVLMLNTMLLSPAWTREQERDADLLGTDLLVRAGYSPQAALSLLRKQAQFERERASDPEAQSLERQLSTFGIDVNRQAQKQGQKVAQQAGVDNPLLGAVLGAGVGKALEWGSKQANEAQRSHPRADERLVEVQTYVAREYPGAGAPALHVESWDTAKEQDGTVEVLENYIAAIEAKGKLADGDLAAAGKLSKASLSGPTRAHAYPNYVAAALQIAEGRAPAAAADYQTAISGPEPAGAIYSEASVLYLTLGKRDEARQVIESGYRRLQEPPSLTVPLIRTYRAVGKQADADRVAAECGMRWPKLQTLCSDEAKGRKPSP